MLSVSTIAEAIAFLSKQTGHEWTDSELFDIAARRGISLHAAVPITVATTIRVFEVGAPDLVEKMRLPAGHSMLAVLFPSMVGQLWLCGETTTSHPLDHDQTEGEYRFLTEPIRVTRAEVRIRSESLRKILKMWDEAHSVSAQRQNETPAERKIRIEKFVDTKYAEGKSKESSYKDLATIEKCSVQNIKNIYKRKSSNQG